MWENIFERSRSVLDRYRTINRRVREGERGERKGKAMRGKERKKQWGGETAHEQCDATPKRPPQGVAQTRPGGRQGRRGGRERKERKETEKRNYERRGEREEDR